VKLNEFFGNTHRHNKDDDRKDRRDGMTGQSRLEDEKLVDEVFWSILDNDKLHKEHFLPLAREIREKQKTGQFDHKEYSKKWMPMVEKGCMEFYHKHKMQGDPRDLFNKEVRKALCQKLADQHHADIEKDEYKLGK